MKKAHCDVWRWTAVCLLALAAFCGARAEAGACTSIRSSGRTAPHAEAAAKCGTRNANTNAPVYSVIQFKRIGGPGSTNCVYRITDTAELQKNGK